MQMLKPAPRPRVDKCDIVVVQEDWETVIPEVKENKRTHLNAEAQERAILKPLQSVSRERPASYYIDQNWCSSNISRDSIG